MDYICDCTLGPFLHDALTRVNYHGIYTREGFDQGCLSPESPDRAFPRQSRVSRYRSRPTFRSKLAVVILL